MATTVSSIEMSLPTSIQRYQRLFLSAGESSTPGIYFFFSLIFLGLTAVWIYICRQEAEHTHHIHILMAMLVLLKADQTLPRFDYSYEKAYGVTVGWTAIYYGFAFLKASFSWYPAHGHRLVTNQTALEREEKRIFMLVLPLQIVDISRRRI